MPDREFDPGRIAEFRRNAEEMLATAQASTDPDIALSYLALAAQWKRLADLVDHLGEDPALKVVTAALAGAIPLTPAGHDRIDQRGLVYDDAASRTDDHGETHARP